MKKVNEKIIHAKTLQATALFIMILINLTYSGCGESNITGIQKSASGNTSGALNTLPPMKDSTFIKLDMNIKFKSECIAESKLLESNNGNKFNHINSFSMELNAGEEIDLQQLQPSGIFGLYISSEGTFTLSNSDGMSFSSRTVLMEKCSFIDLKIRNNEQSQIKISGFVAGE